MQNVVLKILPIVKRQMETLKYFSNPPTIAPDPQPIVYSTKKVKEITENHAT